VRASASEILAPVKTSSANSGLQVAVVASSRRAISSRSSTRISRLPTLGRSPFSSFATGFAPTQPRRTACCMARETGVSVARIVHPALPALRIRETSLAISFSSISDTGVRPKQR
jgi:hypothetical protein